MIRLMVVDDQPVARRGIRDSIDWEQHGISIVAEASHGGEAIELIRKTKPDIVLTDIRMPVMDGLELAHRIRTIMPETEVIIVSGYQDFGYAQQAVRAGVSDYLLKPVGAEELVATVTRVRSRVESARSDRRLRRSFEEIHRENRLLLRGRVVAGLVDGRHDPAAFGELMESMDAKLAGPVFQVIALHLAPLHQRSIRLPQALPSSRVSALAEELETDLGASSAAFASSDRPGRFEILLARGSGASTPTDELSRIIARWERSELLVSVGIGVSVAGVPAIPASWRSALHALENLWCGTRTRIAVASAGSEPAPDDPGQIRRAVQLTELEKAFVEAIIECDTDGAGAALRSLSERIRVRKVGREQVRRLYAGVLMVGVSRIEEAPKIAGRSVDNEELLRQSDRLGNCDQLDAWANAWARTLIESHSEAFAFATTPLARAAIRKISASGGRDISLQSLAAELGVTPNHLGHVFRSDVGQRFTDWLNAFRIERGKHLLADPARRVYEVANEVGINDAGYFQTLFKRHTGLTPTDYRKTRNA